MYRAIAILVGLLTCAPLFAQIPETETRPRSTRQLQGALDDSDQSRVCTPAEYGDPAADCIPPKNRRTNRYELPNELDYPPVTRVPRELLPMDLPQEETSSDNRKYREQSPPVSSRPEREPPTEFQRYIQSSTGVALPLYGASLFENVPDTFAPLDRVPVGPDYRIAPGDELQIAVWGQFNLSRRLVVTRNGEVIVPDAGPVPVAGLNDSQAAAVLKRALERFYKNFDLSVSLGRLHSMQVFVVGEARHPGSYAVSSLSTLVNAVFASGGPSSRGSMRHIEVKRGAGDLCDFDLYELLRRGDKSHDVRLLPGDVILIPPAGPRIAVLGSVERPAIYELTDGATLGDILDLAGGLSPLAAGGEAIVERVAKDAGLQVLRMPLSGDGLRSSLQNGDLIRVLPVVPRFQNAVTLRGNVADPARIPWHAGMRLHDVIPSAEALLTRDYWKDRNQVYLAENRDSTALTSASKTVSDAAPLLASRRPSFRDEPRNIQGDSSFGAATSNEEAAPVRHFTPRNSIDPAAPDINWEYASIERVNPQTLATRIVPFHPGRLLWSHDERENLALEPGDVITIFSKADFSIPREQQAKQIRLEGEIAMAGIYTAHPGETLREVVERAGGLTRNAYLYGAQFTRESTRREQQKRYNDFVDQFEKQVNEAASNLSSRVISPQQAATAQTSVASQRDLVERLRKVAMNGRIVLDMQPNSRGEADLPDLPLENGDRLYIPSRPSTVNVIGTVFEQSSFLYQEDLRVEDYLKKAGGPARSADKSHMFVVRADGSVVSRTVSAPLFAKSFNTLPMFPGDTLVVPTYINKSTFTRDLMDWSQIFSNLALGAAAINVLY